MSFVKILEKLFNRKNGIPTSHANTHGLYCELVRSFADLFRDSKELDEKECHSYRRDCDNYLNEDLSKNKLSNKTKERLNKWYASLSKTSKKYVDTACKIAKLNKVKMSVEKSIGLQKFYITHHLINIQLKSGHNMEKIRDVFDDYHKFEEIYYPKLCNQSPPPPLFYSNVKNCVGQKETKNELTELYKFLYNFKT